MTLTLSVAKRDAARAVGAALAGAQRIALTTHVNPDGDGLGSEVALAHLLRAAGRDVVIVNPTATPSRFEFLFRDLPGVDRHREAIKELRRADLICVLDIADTGRLGSLGATLSQHRAPVICVDHHASPGTLPPGPSYVDPGAAATGELIYELALANGWPVTVPVARALYVALLTDTGGFRFSNTHPRTLRVAADLLETGIDPESIYLDVYATAPEGRPRLLAETLQTLVVERDLGLAWVTVPPGAMERYDLTPDDLDGVVEHPRSIAGVRLAILFREMSQGRVKVSLRSVGDVDVARFASQYGGGGHSKAAGVALPGSLAEVQETVLTAAREYLLKWRRITGRRDA
ncbi:MAG TPA: bifunctional oligoribonuclease/PAP phosphatase NrnA [Gemmatimonadales bacterium]